MQLTACNRVYWAIGVRFSKQSRCLSVRDTNECHWEGQPCDAHVWMFCFGGIFFLEFTSHFHLRSCVRAKQYVRLSTRVSTITHTHTPTEDSHSYEKQIGLFWCCLLDSNPGLKTAGQIKHILTWQRNSRVSWRMLSWKTRHIGIQS